MRRTKPSFTISHSQMETFLRPCLPNAEINPCSHLIAQLRRLEDQCSIRNTGPVVGKQEVGSCSVIYQVYDPGKPFNLSHSFLDYLVEQV